MAADRVFVDINVLVYANQIRSPFHEAALARLAGLTEQGLAPCLSAQVLCEFYSALTRPQAVAPAFQPQIAAQRLRSFSEVFEVLRDGPDVLERLLSLGVSGKQIHDANIVATMSVHAIGRLLTANPADFRRFADIIDIEPL
ncbi:type II toxin-antitoxin system VapC family toxin [Chelatococcus sambhunathii]|uniref:Ribonuclease VapC n=1 Tax=Chelatococcus sambhunathii TaxID=363953 RepID=A0ABU1DFB2_9HYPH|nr:type II toxin-antitoxin system VapC family toxin [Chelatococcus sambhunathii]MDR4306818.1 type II toxin-antitoxin system VapC family toxin [Chelatococcus sambhunathii]